MKSLKFSKLIIQTLNKKFRYILLKFSEKNQLFLSLNKNTFHFILNHRETSILFNLLKNFDYNLSLKKNRSSFFKKSNQIFLLDTGEESNSLKDESKLPTIKKSARLASYDKAVKARALANNKKKLKKQREHRPGKKYNFPSSKFHLAKLVYRQWIYERSLKKNFLIRSFISFNNKMLISFLHSNKKVNKASKTIAIYVKNHLLFFFLFNNIIFNVGLIHIFLHKTFFLVNAYNSSSLFK